MDTYKITNIDTSTGNITVSFSVDNKEQVIAGAPIDDKIALQQFLTNYCVAYKAGLEIEKGLSPQADVSSLIGQTVTITQQGA